MCFMMFFWTCKAKGDESMTRELFEHCEVTKYTNWWTLTGPCSKLSFFSEPASKYPICAYIMSRLCQGITSQKSSLCHRLENECAAFGRATCPYSFCRGSVLIRSKGLWVQQVCQYCKLIKLVIWHWIPFSMQGIRIEINIYFPRKVAHFGIMIFLFTYRASHINRYTC